MFTHTSRADASSRCIGRGRIRGMHSAVVARVGGFVCRRLYLSSVRTGGNSSRDTRSPSTDNAVLIQRISRGTDVCVRSKLVGWSITGTDMWNEFDSSARECSLASDTRELTRRDCLPVTHLDPFKLNIYTQITVKRSSALRRPRMI